MKNALKTLIQRNHFVRLLVVETRRIPMNAEQIVETEVEVHLCGSRTGLVQIDERYIILVRSTVMAGNKIPVRAANLNTHGISLRKGDSIG